MSSASDETTSFGFTKDAQNITRRPSYSESLKSVLQKIPGKSQDPAIVLKEKGAGYMLKKSSAGRYNKRWFAVHGHYLSYFRTEPNWMDTKPVPLGVLNLWHVEGVSIDDATISLRLSEHASQARQEEMGSEAAKRLIAGNSLANGVFRRFDQVRRGGSDNYFILRAPDAKIAQVWLSLMRETPLMGSLASLHKALDEEAELTVKAFRISLTSTREFIFADAASLFTGSTDVLLRKVPSKGASIHVTVGATKDGNGEFQVSAALEPHLEESGGEVVLQTPLQHDIRVQWVRKYPTYGQTLTSIGLIFLMMTVLTLILVGSIRASVITGALCAVGMGVLSIRSERAENNVLIRNIQLLKRVNSAGSPTSSPVSSPRSTRKKPSSLTIDKKISYTSSDPHITPEEAVMIVQLRERVRDMWNIHPEADAFIKRNERFLRDWHADVQAIKNVDKIKEVMDKHINEDHRIVRFIRARKHKLDKAEHMLRDSLLWRVALGSERMLEDSEITPPPEWICRYFGSKYILKMLRPKEDFDVRLNDLFVRDKEGHLGIFFRAGRMNTRKIFRKMCSKPAYMMKLVIWTTELLRHDLERYREMNPNKPETLISVIVDLDGFSISEHVPLGDLIPLARRFFPIFATSYPELLNRVLVFSAPWLFGSLWTAVKPFIPEEVQEKIQIHSGAINYEKHVRPYFADECVPKYIGGKMVDKEDGNEFCLDRICPYGPYGMENEGYELLEGFDLKAQTCLARMFQIEAQ